MAGSRVWLSTKQDKVWLSADELSSAAVGMCLASSPDSYRGSLTWPTTTCRVFGSKGDQGAADALQAMDTA